MGSCRWLGRDAEQGGGTAVVRLQRGEARGEAVVKEGAARAAVAGRSSRARRRLRNGGEGAALFKGVDS